MASETVTLQGHIIDSLILAKVLDAVVMLGGRFDLTEVSIGTSREDSSFIKIHIDAATQELLGEILEAIQPHGATVSDAIGLS